MKKKKPDRSRERIEEYVDSPMMTWRIRHGQELAARIHGTLGVYRTRAYADRSNEGHCTCPSERWPCKHVLALLETWEVNPASFVDLTPLLEKLAAQSKESLLAVIGEMALRAPESLAALGIEMSDEEDDDYDDEVDYEG